MIETGWDEYRGWAARARRLQENLRRWNIASLICIVAAAFLGGLAIELKDIAPWGARVALAAAVAAAAAPVIGREILSSAVEQKWLRCRSLAEAIKSECYRVAAGVAPYDGADAAARFVEWRDLVTKDAAAQGIVPLTSPTPPAGDKRRPSAGMDADWYLKHRIEDQRDWYIDRQQSNEAAAKRLRWLNIGASLAAAALAAAAAAKYPVTAWAGVFITISAAIVAVGLLERRHSLAAQYGAMAIATGRLPEWQKAANADFKALVDRTESLLASEHTTWAQTMAKTSGGPKPEVKADSKPKPAEPKG